MIQAPDGFTFSDTLHTGDETVLLRGRREADGLPVLLRCARNANGAALARLEHEYLLRADLDPAWAATPLALLNAPGYAILVLSDTGALPLARAAQPEAPLQQGDLPSLLRSGAAIALALSQLHRQDLVHQDLKPEHVLIDPLSGEARLTGFGLAERVPPPQQEGGEGASLAYMAPEQTGRLRRAPDPRSDLYSLGVTLYELLTGTLPAGPADILAPRLQRAGLDATCAAIVAKLLAPSAEQRYQSAAGVYGDLQHCLSMLEAQGRVEPFVLARHDGAARLLAPHRLVGRAPQRALLEQAARRVASRGAAELVLVCGSPGTGKTALIGALQRAEAANGVQVVAGKFDQHQRDIPYATLAQAFQQVVRGLLGQDEAELERWRARLLAALGPNARLMLDLIPELRHVVGEPGLHPEPQRLAPAAAQARFQQVFRQFVCAFARPQAMLLLCLDDMQWSDQATLKLLAHLLAHSDVCHLLVVGACRLTEQGDTTPSAPSYEALLAGGQHVSRIELPALGREDAAELVSTVLDCAPLAVAPLSALVHAKTGGNPFFTLQFLTRLVESGLLRFDLGADAWQWDADAIAAREFSDNVIDLLMARLRQLPGSTLDLLKLLACLGHDAGLETIAQVAGMSLQETDECLWPASRLGLVVREPGAYRFVHDRVREGAYLMIGPSSRPERHLHIGRLLQRSLCAQSPDKQLFAVVHHLNRARAAIQTPAALRELARLNLDAGQRARNAVAYDAGRHYLNECVRLALPDAWEREPEATFTLHLALAECEYLCGNAGRCAELFALLAGHVRSSADLARLALLRVAAYPVSGRFDLAVEAALEALDHLGMRFPNTAGDMAAALAKERAEIAATMRGRTIGGLLDIPACTDPKAALVAELLSEMGSSVFSARPELFPLLAASAFNFTLCHGTSAGSSMILARYAMLLVSLGAPDEAAACSALALSLAAREPAPARRIGRLQFIQAAYVTAWREPLALSVPLLEQAFEACRDSGDLVHAGYAAHIAIWHSWEAGAPLAEVQQRVRLYQERARRQSNAPFLLALRCSEQLILCLQGATSAPGSLDDAGFKSADAFAAFAEARFGAAEARFYVMHQIAAYFAGQYEQALEASGAVARRMRFFQASLAEPCHHFYAGLTMAALHDSASRARQAKYVAALREKRDRLGVLAAQCPANFACRHHLLDAELARIRCQDLAAMRAYDDALGAARAYRLIHLEALAGELAALFYQARGFGKIALAYALDAVQAYLRWGAFAKVDALERRFPALLDAAGRAPLLPATGGMA